jgi:hypothetical protein
MMPSVRLLVRSEDVERATDVLSIRVQSTVGS